MKHQPLEAALALETDSLTGLDAFYASASDYLLGAGNSLCDLRSLRGAYLSRRAELTDHLTMGLSR